jgi:hypothetical protein
MNFQSIHTLYGLQRMAAAEAAGKALNLTDIAVGDGAGNDTVPSELQDHLVRERFRAKVNRVYQDHPNPRMFTAEVVIPAAVGGFTMREIGIFDADGGLFAVGNLPAAYKPTADEGAYGDTALRMDFMVSNTAVVTIVLDPNVAVATQAWVAYHVTMASLLPGGTTGQVARKRSNADGDIEWGDVVNVNVIVDTIEETQLLVDGQTAIDLQYVTTKGLAIYIAQGGANGERLPKEAGPNGWQPDPDDVTRAILGKAYPGAKAILVQNEPVGAVAEPLAKEKNLADVPDKALARQNLGAASTDDVARAAPVGQVAYFATQDAPSGWFKANGANVSRTAYAELFAKIGETFGKGDGFNTFTLPDLRAEFIRGLDDGRGVDKDRKLGSAQAGQNLAHNHTGSTDVSGSHSHSYVDGRPVHPPGDPGLQNGTVFKGIWENQDLRETGTAGSHWHSITTSSSGGTEARPRNIAMLACIKY